MCYDINDLRFERKAKEEREDDCIRNDDVIDLDLEASQLPLLGACGRRRTAGPISATVPLSLEK